MQVHSLACWAISEFPYLTIFHQCTCIRNYSQWFENDCPYFNSSLYWRVKYNEWADIKENSNQPTRFAHGHHSFVINGFLGVGYQLTKCLTACILTPPWLRREGLLDRFSKFCEREWMEKKDGTNLELLQFSPSTQMYSQQIIKISKCWGDE